MVEDHPIVTDDYIKEYSANAEVIRFMQKQFSRLNRVGAIHLIKILLKGAAEIKSTDIIKKDKTFLRYNLSKFNAEKKLKLEIVENLRLTLNGFLTSIGKDIVQYGDKEDHKDFNVKDIDGVQCYVLDKHTLYSKVRKLVCDEGGDVTLKYNFNKPDLELNDLKNIETLQRCQIQILSTSVKFDYPIENVYSCPVCEGKTNKKAYETASTGGKLSCPNIYNYLNGEGEPKSRLCKINLSPDSEICITKDAYYYDISYEDVEGDKHTIGALSFNKYDPGFYDCVLFKLKNPKKTELYHMTDVKPLKDNTFKVPEHIKDENYLFTFQRTLDTYIKHQTGMDIYGLLPIKISLILQKLLSDLKMRLIFNIGVIGDASTGKSTVLKYYGFLLNNQFNLSSNGTSISIAGLRGTRESINLMGKDQKIITTGFLGTFKTIHIDELGENVKLAQNLKSFLLEDNYGYDRAGATGVFNKRTAQVNISANLDYNHTGMYRAMVKKTYRDDTIKIGDEEKLSWDENWDLYLSLFKYNNMYLRKAINDIRIEFMQKKVFWIDGWDYALHERFPFYFYLVNEKDNDNFKKILKANVMRDTISENLEIIKVLKTDDITKFFLSLEKYKDSESDNHNFIEVDKILDQYGINADARMRTFYYMLVKLSRIMNKRFDIHKDDLNLLRWFIEKTNCKLDMMDTIDSDVKGPPDIIKQKEIDLKIEEETKQEDSAEFGIQGDFSE